MIYGDEKRRQMARSILPSRARVWARQTKRHLNKQVRHRVKQELREVLFDADHGEESEVDFCEEPHWAFFLWERRAADKLAHFETWAVEITKHIPEPSGRRAHIRSLLPEGLIGWHAMEHLRNYDAFREVPRHPVLAISRREYKARSREKRERAMVWRKKKLCELFEIDGAHRALNLAMRDAHRTVTWDEGTPVGPESPRLLRGLDDIDAFLSDLVAACKKAFVRVDPYLVRKKEKRYSKEHTYIAEYVYVTRERPGFHPEWLESLDRFLAGGDDSP